VDTLGNTKDGREGHLPYGSRHGGYANKQYTEFDSKSQ
jgi:hypothetical protein